MNDKKLEVYLLAAKPIDGPYSPFTKSVIKAIRKSAEHGLHYEKTSMWKSVHEFMRRSTLRRAVMLALVVLVVASIGLTSYAYATGTDPFSLIKRWIVGEQVRVTYHDPQTNRERQFSYGAKRTYSDLAVSAFAEISLIDLLHFHAANSYTVPKDGIEYIEDPFRIEYIYPRVGTIEQVTNKEVTLHLTYAAGMSKIERSHDIDERVTIPREYFYYYQDGRLAQVQESSVGKLVEVYQDQYLRHKQHAGQRPTPVDLYSVFALTHPMDAIRDATTTKGPAQAETDEELQREISEQDLHELGAGAWAQTCLGNGADTCPHAFNELGDNFFNEKIVSGSYGGSSPQNPDMLPFGEAITSPTAITRQYQLRHIEGKIDKIIGDQITIKTSSGALWTFQYSVDKQTAFARVYGKPLKPGQLIAGGVIASVYDWDRRDFDNQHVYGMSRY